ncbi:transposase [Simkania negevensis]|uniref:Transposase DDE domain-containing protein n=1 Tax=Simkania negevensis (strain ATCC VR-1471 / DSM 27360 / Z) TaxID=331113 RepID=F8L2S5_SIMNZ|nr:transposase [Simkania negevensis]CCB87771.1 hypothetical protein SNE_B24120 [Simkania negevensis Z]
MHKRNWHKYNRDLVKRGSITFFIDPNALTEKPEENKRGRPRLFSLPLIYLLLVLKIQYRLTYRTLEGFAKSILPHIEADIFLLTYSLICKRASHMEALLPKLSSRRPKVVLLDTTGIKFEITKGHEVESALNSSRRKILEKLVPGSTSGLDDSELKGALSAFIQEKGSQIKTLDLKYLGLKLLPPELFKFKNLERLDLAGNNIVFIPPAIKELRNLKFLGTGMNQGIILPSYLQRDLKIEDPFSLKGTLGGMIKIKPRNFLDDIASFFSYVGSMSILNSIFKNVSPSTN